MTHHRHLFVDGDFRANADVQPREDVTIIHLWSSNSQQLVRPDSHSDRWLSELLAQHVQDGQPTILHSTDPSNLTFTYLIERRKTP